MNAKKKTRVKMQIFCVLVEFIFCCLLFYAQNRNQFLSFFFVYLFICLLYIIGDVASCDTNCYNSESCDYMEFICNATDSCSLEYANNSCTDCRYYCPFMKSNPTIYNYSQDCSCTDEFGTSECESVIYPTLGPTSVPSMMPTQQPVISTSAIPVINGTNTNENTNTNTNTIAMTASATVTGSTSTTIGNTDTTMGNNGNLNMTMVSTREEMTGNSSDSDDGLSSTDDGDVSDINVVGYNLVFAIMFLILLFWGAHEVYVLNHIGFFKVS